MCETNTLINWYDNRRLRTARNSAGTPVSGASREDGSDAWEDWFDQGLRGRRFQGRAVVAAAALGRREEPLL